ncbi:MAG: AAA family ATPase [Clostridia bacterium]|nr:AAA family ATPase [Clostridia bacterium]
MSKYISELTIKQYRGINDLRITNIGEINVLVGNNNVGKTSILEAIKILSIPDDIGNLVRVAISRYSGKAANFMDSLLTIFQANIPDVSEAEKFNIKETYELSLGCKTDLKDIKLQIMGSVSEKIDFSKADEPIKKSFDASSIIEINGKKVHHPFSISSYDIEVGNCESIFDALFMPVNTSIYKSCVNLYTDVIKNHNKNDFINIMQIFDKNIYDINIIDEMIWIHNKRNGVMPLFSYGAGMQKALLLGMLVTLSKDGILLVDEIETAIHTTALKDVFSFFVSACKQMRVQAFVTTHSIEAIDSFLGVADDMLETMRIMTFRKNDISNKTYARVMSGNDALENRNEYEMELRI